MKLDQINKNRHFTKRLLNDFSSVLFAMLQEKPMEDITIGELCNRAEYPRSSFYNYFEDINALMDYCWETIYVRIRISDFQNIEHDVRTVTLFKILYDYVEENRNVIDRLLSHNSADGMMIQSLDAFIRKSIFEMIKDCQFSYKYPVPCELLARHYSNTIQMILSECLMDRTITKKQAAGYLNFLLGTLEKECMNR